MENHNKSMFDIFRESFAPGDRIPASTRSAGEAHGMIDVSLGRIMNIYSNSPPDPVVRLAWAILHSHAPDEGLLRLERLISALDGRGLPAIIDDDVVQVVSGVLASSAALSRRLGADPALFGLLAATNDLMGPWTCRDDLLSHIACAMPDGADRSERMKTIHRIQTVHLMRICARNTKPGAPIDTISLELSSLAEAVIETTLEVAADDLAERPGLSGTGHGLVVLGLGKLGGRELNVSSDVDLIFLCPDDAAPRGRYDGLTYHTMLAERLSRFLTEPTSLGSLYRVDTRLRADGSSGPLVRSTRDYFRYLEIRGEAWERQMLLKARPIAGDIRLGVDFLASIERFVFPASLTRSPNREIVSLKNQIEARLVADGSKKTHLKLMPGGIRDIEFIVQCLQLLMGGLHPEVRTTGTLAALDSLRGTAALNDREYTVLTSAYRLYRRIENALQWLELLPAFILPENVGEREALARLIGLPADTGTGAGRLDDLLNDRLARVRAIYDDIFSSGGDGSFEEMAVHTATCVPDDEHAGRFLESLGFADPSSAIRDLSFLTAHSSISTVDAGIHPSAEKFIPILLRALSEQADPGGALERFKRVADAYGALHTLFDILTDNGPFLELLLAITGGSRFMTDILAKDPSLLDWLVETGSLLEPLDARRLSRDIRDIDAVQQDDTGFTGACLLIKHREKLRIGARDITGIAETGTTYRELTTIAEMILHGVNDRSLRAMKARHPVLRHDYDFIVIAAGRLGAEVMNYGSDLDLIFVYTTGITGSEALDIPDYSARLARGILHLLGGGGGPGRIYEVDARLRPEGGNAMLAVSLEEYRRYLLNRASVWERLALVRARAIAGGRKKSAVMEAVHAFVYGRPFSTGDIDTILDIRRAMETKARTEAPGLVNIKVGPGGLADINFLAHAYAAHHGGDTPSLRTTGTTGIIGALRDAGLITIHDASALDESYRFLLDVDKALRISTGTGVSTLPESGAETARVARALGHRNIRRFRRRLDDVLDVTRGLYGRLMEELRART